MRAAEHVSPGVRLSSILLRICIAATVVVVHSGRERVAVRDICRALGLHHRRHHHHLRLQTTRCKWAPLRATPCLHRRSPSWPPLFFRDSVGDEADNRIVTAELLQWTGRASALPWPSIRLQDGLVRLSELAWSSCWLMNTRHRGFHVQCTSLRHKG